MIIANQVGSTHTGFNTDHNEVTVISAQKELHLPLASKVIIAQQIIDIIAEYISEAPPRTSNEKD